MTARTQTARRTHDPRVSTVSDVSGSQQKGALFSAPFSPLTFAAFTTVHNIIDLVMASAAGMAGTSARGVTATARTGCAVRTASTITAAAAAVTRSAVIATVAAGRPWLHNGLPHVELRTRRAAALIAARSGSVRVA